MDHPTWSAHISVNRKDYAEFSRPCPKVSSFNVVSKLDSCAQSCLWSKKEYLGAGFKEEDLIPVSLGLKAANKSSIEITGAIFVRINVEVNNKKTLLCYNGVCKPIMRGILYVTGGNARSQTMYKHCISPEPWVMPYHVLDIIIYSILSKID
jgi:hypothetical protein